MLVSVWDRVKQYKDEHLSVVNAKLHCDSCNEIISKKNSSIKKHVLSKKHLTGKKAIEANKSNSSQLLIYYEERMREFTRKGKLFLMKCVCFDIIL